MNRKQKKIKIGNSAIILIILIVNVVYWLNDGASTSVVLETPKKKQSKPFAAELVSIKFIPDGDTVHLTDGRKVRIYAIDAPEIYYKEAKQSKIGIESREFLRKLLKKASVQLLINSETPVDQYDRILGDLLVDGKSVAEEIVKNGFAYTYSGIDIDLKEKLVKLEREARKNKKGIWKETLDRTFFENYSEKFSLKGIDENNHSDIVLSGKIVKVSKSVHILKIYVKIENEEIPVVIKFEHWHHFDDDYFSEKIKEDKLIWCLGRANQYRGKFELGVRYPHQIFIE